MGTNTNINTVKPGAESAAAAANAVKQAGHDLLQDDYKYSLQHLPIQRKLAIGAADDPLEQEADAMADTIMRMPEQHFIQRKCAHCEEEEQVQRKPVASSITPFIQTKGADGGTASNTVTNQINATRGAGSSMDRPTQSYMESRFGTDFSNVKIHTGTDAVQMSRELNAQAFTVGNGIYFNSGKYNPSSDSGKHLLAHELTHTVQQGKNNRNIQRKTWVDDESDCTSTQKIKVQLIFDDVGADVWTAPRKTKFKNEFKASIEDTFNTNSFQIKPSTGSYVPWYKSSSVTCPCFPDGFKPKVKIELAADDKWSTGEDWEVDVAANSSGKYIQSENLGGYADLNEAGNTPVPKKSSGPGVTQKPTVHEFGHFLGLNHPGAGLSEGVSIRGVTIIKRELSPGASEYSHIGKDKEGRTVDGTIDLMGGGMGLRPFYFDTWLNHIQSKYKYGCKYTTV